MSLYTGEGTLEKKSRKSQDLKQISVLVPKDFDTQKRDLGVSWRVLIARGLRESDTQKLRTEVEYFLGRAEKLHQENMQLKQRLFKLENAQNEKN